MTERLLATIGLKHESEKMRKILGVSLIPSFLVKLNNIDIDKEEKVA